MEPVHLPPAPRQRSFKRSTQHHAVQSSLTASEVLPNTVQLHAHAFQSLTAYILSLKNQRRSLEQANQSDPEQLHGTDYRVQTQQ